MYTLGFVLLEKFKKFRAQGNQRYHIGQDDESDSNVSYVPKG